MTAVDVSTVQCVWTQPIWLCCHVGKIKWKYCNCAVQCWCQPLERLSTPSPGASPLSCPLPQVLVPALYIHLTGSKGCCGNRCGVSSPACWPGWLSNDLYIVYFSLCCSKILFLNNTKGSTSWFQSVCACVVAAVPHLFLPPVVLLYEWQSRCK